MLSDVPLGQEMPFKRQAKPFKDSDLEHVCSLFSSQARRLETELCFDHFSTLVDVFFHVLHCFFMFV